MKKRLLIVGLIVGLAAVPAMSVRGKNAGQDQRQPKQIVDIEMTDVWADACRIWFRVTNKGNVKIDKVLREQVWVDDVLKDDTKMHYVLEPGAVFAHGVGADPGVKVAGLNRKVKAFIDGDNDLKEFREYNNSKEVTLSCRLAGVAQVPALAKPDLVVSFDFTRVIRKDPNADGNFIWWADVVFTVTNQGVGGSGACKILFEKDSGPGGAFAQAGPEISIPAIGGGGTFTITKESYQHTGPAPTYRATVDCHNAVIETNEDNNKFTKKFPY